MYLQNENYTVYKAYTAQGALDYIRKEEFDLAIIRSSRYGKSKLVTAKILAAFVYSMITFTLFLLLRDSADCFWNRGVDSRLMW